jgi:uncharacterized phage protein gp47/JayE
MAFSRPTLPELVQRVYTDLSSKSGIQSPLKKSILKAFAYAIAGTAHLLFGFLDFIYKQAFPTTCNEEVLIVWAYIYSIPRKQASFAERDVKFTGTDGSVIPALTILKKSDGTEYETQSEVTITLGEALVKVLCETAGTIGNIDTGLKLNLVSPVSGVNSQATVQATNQINGQDQEEIELWRGRILSRIKEPPHGGNQADYEAWALEIPGVTRAWIYPSYLGIGTVGLSFVNDAEADIFPTAAKVTEVQNAIDKLRPVTADLTVFAPVKHEISFDIQISPNTTDVRTAIENQLRALLKREGVPGGKIFISHVREAISLAPGEFNHVLISPVTDIVSPQGNLPVVGLVTFSVTP